MPAPVSDSELIEALEELAAELGRTPTKQEMEEKGRFGRNTYNKHFGSWNNALEKCGLEPNKIHGIGKTELLNEIKNLADELGETPTQKDMREYGRFSPVPYFDRFGTWNNSLKEAGLKENREYGISEESLIKKLKQVARQLGHTPTLEEFRQLTDYSTKPYRDNWGSWNKALEKAGLEKNVEYTNDAVDSLYSTLWKPRRRKALERDAFRCQDCGVGRDKHIEKYGHGLEVHHIEPAKNFDDPDERHALDNLVCLCKECHRLRERGQGP